ncbi:hypothetical protein HETIRDRAFT_419876 [Heterobasidion irregulare TC 32-1]|uniref:FAD-binding domain-containing protein n=1 Tax=Heterobasidion irregulare (strain TC 32-1) TaxID=747525 RepID=W4JYJ8_HETIT|nr:uncharacterized protein HETIRDRAFT_419876 [Heterobasidion irregulare TC 32-1]ETW78623.1 hypothetical protein HETIRDRAFT_419876 [Heterobasidion irregulare TC 32-1]
MSLPTDTSVTIVGAGPSGMACALSLTQQGVSDITIVDAVQQAEQSSRALVIHAATLEALDFISVADAIIDLSIKVSETHVFDRKSLMVTIDFDTLRPYTRYPFSLSYRSISPSGY